MVRRIWRFTVTVEEVSPNDPVDEVPTEQAPASESTLDDFHTVIEVAAMLDVSKRTVYRLIKEGQLRSQLVARRRLIHRDDVAAYVQSTRDAGA